MRALIQRSQQKARTLGLGLFWLWLPALAPASELAALQDLNTQWQQLLNQKDSPALSQFYDADSVLEQYPLKADSTLQGLDAIRTMFEQGPFSLADLNATVHPLVVQAQGDTAFVAKQWQIQHQGGAFSGLALEVLAKTPEGWIRRIDLGAGGLKQLADFKQQDSAADNQAFGGIAERVLALPDTTQRPQVDNLLALQSGDRGLLVSHLSTVEHSALVFASVYKNAGQWQIATQWLEKLKP